MNLQAQKIHNFDTVLFSFEYKVPPGLVYWGKGGLLLSGLGEWLESESSDLINGLITW